MFPIDDYTPHGYLDTATHTWALNPVGVLRSLAPIGMGWHVPNFGSYGRNQFRFSAHLLVGLRVGRRVLLTPEDFASQGITLSSDYHSKNILRIVFRMDAPSLHFQAAFFWIDERALGCLCTLEHLGARPLEVECLLAARYIYNPATTRRWVQGLMSWQRRPKWPACIGLYPEEDHALALHASLPAAGYQAAAALAELRAWLTGEPGAAQAAEPSLAGVPDGCWVRWVGLRYPLALQPGKSTSLTGILAGGVSTEGAQEYAPGAQALAEYFFIPRNG